jgi:hypothetical protein
MTGLTVLGASGIENLIPDPQPEPEPPPPDPPAGLSLESVNWTTPTLYSGVSIVRSSPGWYTNQSGNTVMAVANEMRPLWTGGLLVGTYVEPPSTQEFYNVNFEDVVAGVSTPGGTGSAPRGWIFTGGGAYVLTWTSVFLANERPAVTVRVQASTATNLTLNMLPMGFHTATTTSGQAWAQTWEGRIASAGLVGGQSTFFAFREYNAGGTFLGNDFIAAAFTSSSNPQRLTRTSVTTRTGVAGFDAGFAVVKDTTNPLDVSFTFYAPPQLEKQAFATSQMLSGLFSRAAETGVIPLAAANWSGNTGVTYATVYFTSTSGAGSRNIHQLADASGNNVVQTLISGARDLVGTVAYASGATSVVQAAATALTSTRAATNYTVGIAFALNSTGIAATGGTIKADTSAFFPANMTTMTIGPFPGAVAATYIAKPRPPDNTFASLVGAVLPAGEGEGGGQTPPVLQASGQVVVSANNQIVENLHITVTNQDAIQCVGKSGVTIKNCLITHNGTGYAMRMQDSPGLTIESVRGRKNDAPAAGPLPSERNGIFLNRCNDPVLFRVDFTDFSANLYAVQSPRGRLTFFNFEDPRGPGANMTGSSIPAGARGQNIQLNQCPDWVISDGNCIADVDVAWTEDSINAFDVSRGTMDRVLIDGNNSPSGWATIIETSTTGLTEDFVVTDCDAVNWSNGSFASYDNADDTIFRRCRARDSYTPLPQGRGLPSSNSLCFGAGPGSQRTRLEDCEYFNLVNPTNLTWQNANFSLIDIASVDFTPRAAIVLANMPGD